MKFSSHHFFVFILILISIQAFTANADAGQPDSSDYRLQVYMPPSVANNSVLEVEFELTTAGYDGPVAFRQKLPVALSPVKPLPVGADIETRGTLLQLNWDEIPAADDFHFIITYQVHSKLSAVFPFEGEVLIDGTSVHFTYPLQVENKPTANEHGQAGAADVPLHIEFKYPDLLSPGASFTFVTRIVGKPGYNPPGELLQIWPEGFEPRTADLSGGRIEIEGQQVVVTWKKMSSDSGFSIAYPVFVDTLPGGAYLLVSEYTNLMGLHLNNSCALAVRQGPEASGTTQLKQSSGSVIAVNGEATAWNDEIYSTNIAIDRSGLQGAASLQVILPPGSRLAEDAGMHGRFDSAARTVIFHWNEFPAGPKTDISLNLDLSNVKPAVYPLVAKLVTDLGRSASATVQVTVSNEKPQVAKNQVTPKPASFDTTEIFSRLDSLLIAWKKSTGADATKTAGSVLPHMTPAGDSIMVVDQEPGAISDTATSINVKTFYGVQIIASQTPLNDLERKLARKGVDEPLTKSFDGEWYRYMLGPFETYQKAAACLDRVKRKGFPDAFVVNYVDGEKSKIIY